MAGTLTLPLALTLTLACCFPISPDISLHLPASPRHTQWFLYRVRNMRAGQEYSISIINMMKPDSLFCSG